MASTKLHMTFRKYHRWLGFFLAGIMAVYAVSGILLIFRPTDFLKFEQTHEYQIEAQLNAQSAVDQLRVKGLRANGESDTQVEFNYGSYDKNTGTAVITKKDYPLILAKMVKLHKATNNSPLFWLNISFGIALLFFVISAFLMFLPKLPIYKNGLKIAGVGALFTVLMLVFGS